ncbi:MAG: phosphoenolpyruvate hydrolase family protein [Leucobacter sp.]
MSTILAAAGTRSFAEALSGVAADRIVAYHSSAYRKHGLPSVAGLLPWASANEQTLEMLPEVLAGAGETPVVATVCANDGLIRRAEMITRLKAAGVAGVLNAPTVGLLEGTVRDVLEQAGLGMEPEIALTADAVAAGLESWVYVFDRSWVRGAADAGATGVVIHLGITGYPSPVDLEECLAEAAERGVTEVLLHGGSLTTPEAVEATIASLPPELAATVTGYMGASVFERADDLPSTMQHWRNVLAGTDTALPADRNTHAHAHPASQQANKEQ